MDPSQARHRSTYLAAGTILLFIVIAVAASLAMSRWVLQTDASLQEQVLAIAAQLHAPGDQNTMTVATSSLTLAQHMRYQIQQDLLQGMTSSQILQQMVQTYGPSVLAAPSFRGFGRVAWLIPWVFLFVLACVGGWLLRRGFQSQRDVPPTLPAGIDEDAASALDEKAQRSIDARLQEYY
jgi:cytochrome c-type biogenesis protein CcmH/NrfF